MIEFGTIKSKALTTAKNLSPPSPLRLKFREKTPTEMTDLDLSISSTSGLMNRYCPPPCKAALEEARKKRLKELKMNRIVKETGFYTIFVVVVLFLCHSTRDGMSFYMSESLRNIFITNNGAENAVRDIIKISHNKKFVLFYNVLFSPSQPFRNTLTIELTHIFTLLPLLLNFGYWLFH